MKVPHYRANPVSNQSVEQETTLLRQLLEYFSSANRLPAENEESSDHSIPIIALGYVDKLCFENNYDK